MQAVKKNNSHTEKDFNILWIIAASFTFVLFFIDEGYYDLRWMKNFGNWLFFVLYATFIFLIEFALYTLLFKKLARDNRIVASGIIGVILFLVILYNVF